MSRPPFDAEAWIDVGGTFTDCYVRSGAATRKSKTLSSGCVPIFAHASAAGTSLTARELSGDVDQFWTGAYLRVFDQHGIEIETRLVIDFFAGRLTLDAPLEPVHLASRLELDARLEAPVLAVRRLLGIPLANKLPRLNIRLGTTRGTNALLTRTGTRTLLAITDPFVDLLEIGDQTRPDLFQLAITKRPSLADATIGIRERLNANGDVILPLDLAAARVSLAQAFSDGFGSVAICLMHSYANPSHELQLKQLALEIGFEMVSCSSQIAPLIEIVARAQTTVVDAYLSPIVENYFKRLVDQFGGPQSVQMSVMSSAGGLIQWQHYRGKDSILSGPAGGVAALHGIANSLGLKELIGLDMGGTSTDVARVTDEHSLQYESTKAGIRILTPTLPIETVASGGGSVCWFDGVSLRVGPHSAGALPGPACYGRGGPLTITDLNLLLGRLSSLHFPFPLDLSAVESRIDALMQESHSALGITNRLELAEGFRRIAIEQMAEAVRTVTIASGADPRTHALVGYGGAAGQHICEIADVLGITTIIDSPHAGLLSALGMGMASQRCDRVLSIYCLLTEVDLDSLHGQALSLSREMANELVEQGADLLQLTHCYWLELRYLKSDSTLTVPWLPPQAKTSVRAAFDQVHATRYGYSRNEQGVEVVALRLETLASPSLVLTPIVPIDDPSDEKPPPALTDASRSVLVIGGEPRDVPYYPSERLESGHFVSGPAIVLNAGSTLIIEPNWTAQCLCDGTLQLVKTVRTPLQIDGPSESLEEPFDPIFRDCYAQRMAAIATQMGIVLQRTAVSVNVKQRRDFSCAIFDSSGCLLANAPHVPVHLGAMGQTVRAIQHEFSDISPGDSFITNDPYCGGSHLPDVTLVTPVFSTSDAADGPQQGTDLAPLFFVANRAHHADIGGIAPGSMSVVATQLGQEGVVIPPMRIVASGEDCTDLVRAVMLRSPFPPRNVDENLADLKAQLAANARGVELLRQYAGSTSWTRLAEYGNHLLEASELRVRQYVAGCPPFDCRFTDYLDDGTPLCVHISTSQTNDLYIDFSGSGPVSQTNFNANTSIVTSAVMYVLRCLVADELPLSEGVMRCVKLRIPQGILNPPKVAEVTERPAVAAGNVETSQRIVDVLLGALGAAAASQGTMNNLLFGNQRFGFYETICGGAGATDGAAGANAVHTHMTNTRLTDPEVLEARYPVRLVDFRLRTASGGKGRWNGGDGVVRRIEFLERMQLSLLTSRRGAFAPFGLQGGEPGLTGQNTLYRSDGTRIRLEGCQQIDVDVGDQLELQTPGGGGFGPCDSTDETTL